MHLIIYPYPRVIKKCYVNKRLLIARDNNILTNVIEISIISAVADSIEMVYLHRNCVCITKIKICTLS